MENTIEDISTFFVDTHTHLYDEAYGGNYGEDQAVSGAIARGVELMILPDECGKFRQKMFDLARRWPDNTRPCIGIHPTEIGENWEKDFDDMLQDKENSGLQSRIVAIGETGMDLYWSREKEREQEELFRAHLDLSLKTGLPLIIHAREATEQIFKVLEDYRGRGLKGVFHAFSGSYETFTRIEKYGDWYVGIGGVLTFKKASIAETVAKIPMDRILLETDSPYLTPVPHRGERNESSYIPIIASFLAERVGANVDFVRDRTTKNAIELFNL